ncbi:15022_t:CDS:2, partial [Gigaspora margarita]
MPQHKPILKKRSKREWVIVDENKENQPTIGRVATKRACFTDIVCYENNSKGKSQAGERSSNRVLQEKLSNKVKRTRTEKLIDISLWVKYAKGEMNLELEPEHFINRSEESSILSEKVKSLQSKKEEIRVMIEEPTKEGGEANVSIRVKWVMIEKQSGHSTKKLMMRSTRKAWAKKEEEILDSIKEELKQKEKIDLGLALERMNLSKNKAQDIAVTFLNKWLTFFQRE